MRPDGTTEVFTPTNGTAFSGCTERPVKAGFYPNAGKRALDIVLVLILLPLATPLIAALWLVVKCDGGSGFFAHRRIGRAGRNFRCLKLRTMVPDAEVRLKSWLEEHPEDRAEWARAFKLKNDPRVTFAGRFLRKTSLDELPQLWNVLTGEMSLVGPRPVVADELRHYGPSQTLYLSLRPGMTGAWQVSGRNDLSYGERVRLDTAYARQISMITDLGILMKTALVVIRQTGR